MGRTAGRVEGEVAPELEPNFRANIGQHWGFESGPAQAFRNACYALADAAIKFPYREAVALDVPDDTRGNQLGGRIDHAANDPLRWNFFAEETARIRAVYPAA